MDCIMCGREAGFNRALTAVGTGQRVGRLCRNCEVTQFGRRLEAHDGRGAGCAFCDRDGAVALPQFTAHVVETDGRLVSRNTAEVTDAAPRICEHHLDLMAAFDETRPEGPPSADAIRDDDRR